MKFYLNSILEYDRTNNRTNRQPWDVLSIAKARIIEFVEAPPTTTTAVVGGSVIHTAGVRLAALKFVQRVILVQTRGISSDPRVSHFLSPSCDRREKFN